MSVLNFLEFDFSIMGTFSAKFRLISDYPFVSSSSGSSSSTFICCKYVLQNRTNTGQWWWETGMAKTSLEFLWWVYDSSSIYYALIEKLSDPRVHPKS